jgi:hypothetical protein
MEDFPDYLMIIQEIREGKSSIRGSSDEYI